MIDIFMNWYLFPAVLVLAGFHIAFMLVERSWNPEYDSTTVKETIVLVAIWPVGAGVLCLVTYVMVREAIERKLEK